MKTLAHAKFAIENGLIADDRCYQSIADQKRFDSDMIDIGAAIGRFANDPLGVADSASSTSV